MLVYHKCDSDLFTSRKRSSAGSDQPALRFQSYRLRHHVVLVLARLGRGPGRNAGQMISGGAQISLKSRCGRSTTD